jgi:hypothetical protein
VQLTYQKNQRFFEEINRFQIVVDSFDTMQIVIITIIRGEEVKKMQIQLISEEILICSSN